LGSQITMVLSKCGKNLDFSLLAPTQRSKRVIQRTERAYWRLLCDESQGNAYLALLLMFQGIVEHEEYFEVRMFAQPKLPLDVKEDDLSLFFLLSLFIHEALSEAELADILDCSLPEVSVRRGVMISHGVIAWNQAGLLYIDMKYTVVVRKILRQKHMLHLEERWSF